jgi:two-component system response regulator BaeR
MADQILIVEDEPKLAQLLVDYLKQSGFETHVIGDGQQALEWIQQQHENIDLMILDLMLPNLDGMEICKAVRQFSTLPILMASARVEEIDRLIGLELGADDYLCKPYSPREVVARVKAILRRSQLVKQHLSATQNGADMKPVAEVLAGLVMEEEKYKATLNGKELDLTAVEFQILAILAKEPGRIFSRQQLMDGGYQDHRVVSDRTIDSHIRKLRKRIAEKCPESEIIHSVYGVGYKFELLS